MAGAIPGELNTRFPAGIIPSFSLMWTLKHELQQNWIWGHLASEVIKLDLKSLNYGLELLL